MSEATAVKLEVTQEDFDSFRHAEAVIVRAYKNANGEPFSVVVAWGDLDDMREQAEDGGVFAVPNGHTIIGHTVVPVVDLMGL